MALAILALAGATAAPRHAPPSTKLPAGTGRELVRRNCLICHSAMLIAQQHKDSTGWEKTVTLMQKWGSPIQGAARDTLMAYLNGHLGATPPASAR